MRNLATLEFHIFLLGVHWLLCNVWESTEIGEINFHSVDIAAMQFAKNW